MRDITQENLVRFFGICMDEQNTAVVTELMIRGSLRDILDEGKMEIDWTFRYSMISDIIEGMLFLHNSDIQYHGHLKSTNCVVDGRFMVKIADYGLRSLHKQVRKEQDVNPRALSWTAPGEQFPDPSSFFITIFSDFYKNIFVRLILQAMVPKQVTYTHSPSF